MKVGFYTTKPMDSGRVSDRNMSPMKAYKTGGYAKLSPPKGRASESSSNAVVRQQRGEQAGALEREKLGGDLYGYLGDVLRGSPTKWAKEGHNDIMKDRSGRPGRPQSMPSPFYRNRRPNDLAVLRGGGAGTSKVPNAAGSTPVRAPGFQTPAKPAGGAQKPVGDIAKPRAMTAVREEPGYKTPKKKTKSKKPVASGLRKFRAS